MSKSLIPVYRWGRSWSRKRIVNLLLLVLLMKIFHLNWNLSFQIFVATVALLVGIPHGAIDHLISIKPHPRSRFILFIAIYTAIAIMAGWAISTWNLLGFQLVVIMSALHFGFGDTSFIAELRQSSGKRPATLLTEFAYALSAGFTPLILPLTDSRTLGALNKINPHLDHWAGTHAHSFREITYLLVTISMILFLLKARFDLGLDLFLILLLSIYAPPLIAFAAYFGFWHAIRHTARLVPKLPRARYLAEQGRWRRAIWAAIRPGLYAIVGTIVVAIGLTQLPDHRFSTGLLWPVLVIIWALTVPHMLTTARFDLKDLSLPFRDK